MRCASWSLLLAAATCLVSAKAQAEPLTGGTVGIEVESVGVSTDETSEIVSAALDGAERARASHGGAKNGLLSTWAVGEQRAKGAVREWRVVPDGSLAGKDARNSEIVTPPIKYTASDRASLAKMLAQMKAKKARGSEGSVHVHVDAKSTLFELDRSGQPLRDWRPSREPNGNIKLNGKRLVRLVNFVHQNEAVLHHLFGTTAHRAARFVKPWPEKFVRDINEHPPQTVDDLVRLMERDLTDRNRGVNLFALRKHGTVEFRYGEGTLNPARVDAYVLLTRAVMGMAFEEGKYEKMGKPIEVAPGEEERAVHAFSGETGLDAKQRRTLRLGLQSKAQRYAALWGKLSKTASTEDERRAAASAKARFLAASLRTRMATFGSKQSVPLKAAHVEKSSSSRMRTEQSPRETIVQSFYRFSRGAASVSRAR